MVKKEPMRDVAAANARIAELEATAMAYAHARDRAHARLAELEALAEENRKAGQAWREQWEALEIARASCCAENEQRAELARRYFVALDEIRAKSGAPFATWHAAGNALEAAEKALRDALRESV